MSWYAGAVAAGARWSPEASAERQLGSRILLSSRRSSPAASQEMEIIRREIFGPVIPVVTFDDLEEAIAFANDSDYGLTSSIYTRDLNVALTSVPGDPIRRNLYQPREL